jgi:hypothetical protein
MHNMVHWSRRKLGWLKGNLGVSALVTFVGAAASAVGGLASCPVLVLVGAIIAAGGALLSSGERSAFEHELRMRSDKIANLNREIAASVTGGDSFCYAAMGSLGVDEPNTAILTVVHQGEHPLYDVSFYMVDPQALRNDQTLQMSKAFTVGNMSPNSASPMQVWHLPDADRQNYNIFFSARNGFWSQALRFKRVSGSWKSATQVTKTILGSDEPPLLYERIDPEFPLNEHGQVEW